MVKKILIADDDPDILLTLTDRLQQHRYEVITADNGLEALNEVEKSNPALVLLDLQLPALSGLEILKRLQHRKDSPPIIMLTAFGSIELAVQAIKLGAYDFILKPFAHEYLLTIIEKAIAQQTLKRESEFWRAEVEARYHTIIGESPAMQTILEMARRVARNNASVLLLGESGTGKELIARAIHRWSPRQAHPFMAINCTAQSEILLENELFGHEKGAFTGATERRKGKIEVAEGGTVFLDEIGDMPLAIQSRFLRLLQKEEYYRVGGAQPIQINVRFIAATNKDLHQCVQAGTFREDLYYRLNRFPLTLPPLRDRLTDLPALANYILEHEGIENKTAYKTLSQEALDLMMQYPWPGNIRELENVLARATILCDHPEIGPEVLCLSLENDRKETPPLVTLDKHSSYHEALESYSKTLILSALRKTEWNQTKAAALLNLQRTYFTKLLKQKQIPTKPSSLEKSA